MEDELQAQLTAALEAEGVGTERFASTPEAPEPEGPYTLPMELGPEKTIPILVLGT